MNSKIFLILSAFLLVFSSNMFAQDADLETMKSGAKNIEYIVKLSIESNKATFSTTVNFPKNYFPKNALVFVKPTITGVMNYSSWENQKFAGENLSDTKNAEKVSYSIGGKFSFSRTVDLPSGTYGNINFNISIYLNKDLLITFVETYSLNNGQITENIEDNSTSSTDNTEIKNNDNNSETEIDIIENLDTKENILAEIKINEKEKNYLKLTDLHSDLGKIYENESNFTDAIESYRNAIDYSAKDGKTIETGDLYTDIGKIEFSNNKNLEAISDYKEAIEIYTEKGDKQRVELTYNNLATIYNSMLYYENAIEAYSSAIENCEDSDKEKLAKYSSKIADAYSNMEKLQETVEFYEKTITLEKSSGNNSELISSLNNISTVFLKLGQSEKANSFINQAFELNETSGEEYNNAVLYNNLASINFKAESYEKALENYEKAAEISLNSGNFKSNAIALYNIGMVYLKKNDKEKAKENFNKSLKIAEENALGDIISKNYFMLSKTLSTNGDCEGDFSAYQQFLSESGSLVLDDDSPMLDLFEKYSADLSTDQLIEQLTEKDVELKKQIELNEKQLLKNDALKQEMKMTEERNRKQKILIFVLTAGILIILFLAITAVRESMLKRKANKLLTEKNAQILQQNEEIKAQSEELLDKNDKIMEQNHNIEEINKKITSSIFYAKNIQNAMLPSENYINTLLNNYFILYKPKDIVSGDFYWVATKNEDEVIIVAADCTGHGVPGAMMSMLSMALLNEIVNDNKINEPNHIIDRLRDLVIKSLNKNIDNDVDENQRITRDGMDLALMTINKKLMKIKFAGAENPMVILRKNELLEFEADTMPVGASTFLISHKNFSMKEFDLLPDDMIYIFSDGYADQFGGDKRKKFFKKNMYKLFIEICNKPVDEQKQILEKNFHDWKGDGKQIDDVLIFGIKV